jgi:hypothetical protein
MHSPELIEKAKNVVLPHGCYVQLDDFLFEHHGLGARYALVQNMPKDGQVLSYAALDLPETTYDLISSDENPRALGTFDELMQSQGSTMYAALNAAFKIERHTKDFKTRQQMAFALIFVRFNGISYEDQIGMCRAARWAKQYERRAWWICKHRLEAYAAEKINWKAVGFHRK